MESSAGRGRAVSVMWDVRCFVRRFAQTMARNESISENAVWTALIGACFVPVSGHQPRNSEFCSIVAATRGYNRLKDSDWNRCSQRGGSVLIIQSSC
jgi:hypothetical protein